MAPRFTSRSLVVIWRISLSANRRPPRIKCGAGFRRDMRRHGRAQCGEDRAPSQDFVLGARRGYGAAMDGSTTQRLPARPLALPNILTYARIAAVPLVVACMYGQALLGGGLWLRWVALALFIAAGITDFLDGYFARIWGQQSTFGRMLD